MSIKLKLIVLLLGVSIFLVTTVSAVYFIQVRKEYINEIHAHLESVAESKSDRIRNLGIRLEEIATLLARNATIENAVKEKSFDHLSVNDQEVMSEIFTRYNSTISSFKEISILSSDGIIIYSTDNTLLSKNFSTLESFIIASKGKPLMDGFHFSKTGELRIYVSAPIIINNKFSGAILIEMNASEIVKLTSDYTGLGATGETVIGKKIKDSVVFATPARFDKNAALKLKMDANNPDIPLNKAFAGYKGVSEGTDYRGIRVISSTRYIEQSNWGLVVKIDKDEAFAPVHNLSKQLIIMNLVAALLAILLAVILANIFAEPIELLTYSIMKIENGNLSERAKIYRKDEIGTLAHSFNRMADKLEGKIKQVESLSTKVIESSLNGIAVLEAIRDKNKEIVDLQYIIANQAASDLVKVFPLEGKTFLQVNPNTVNVGIFEVIKNVINTGVSKTIEFYYNYENLNCWYNARYVKFGDGIILTFDDITEQKNAMLEIEHSRNLLLESQSLGGIGSFEWDFQANKLSFTPVIKKILCIQDEKELGEPTYGKHPFFKRILPEDREITSRKLFDAIKNKESYSIEYTISCPDDGLKYLWSRGKPIMDENGKLLKMVGTVIDITQRKKDKQKILDRESLLLEAQKLAKMGNFELDLKNNSKLTWSENLYRLFGYEPGEIEPTVDLFKSLIHEENKNLIPLVSIDNLIDIKERKFVHRINCKNGTTGIVSGKIKLIRDDHGNPSKVVGVLQDITEQVEIENQLKKNEAFLLESQSIARVGSFENDLKKNEITGTPEYYKILGLDLNQNIKYQNILDRVHPDDRETVEATYKKSYETGEDYNVIYRYIFNDNEIKYIWGRAKIQYDENHKPLKLIGSVADITRIKNIEEQLSKSKQELELLNRNLEKRIQERTKELVDVNDRLKKINQQLDKYAYIISHDLKAPLNSIESLSLMIADEFQNKTLNDEGQSMLDMIIQKVVEMKSMIEEVLKTAKEERKIKEPVALFHMAQEVVQTLSPPEYFHIFISHSLPVVKYHRVSMRQILQNLIGNAIKYMDKKDPLIKISSTESDTYYSVSIEDNGQGIEDRKLPGIFEPFEIAHKDETIESHGIGLSIVKQIVEEHGGKIWVQSKFGVGTTFHFTIPKS